MEAARHLLSATARFGSSSVGTVLTSLIDLLLCATTASVPDPRDGTRRHLRVASPMTASAPLTIMIVVICLRVLMAADLQVRARSPLGFNEELYPRVATAAGVADASSVVVVLARAGHGRLTLLGLDVMIGCLKAARRFKTLAIRPFNTDGPTAANAAAMSLSQGATSLPSRAKILPLEVGVRPASTLRSCRAACCGANN